MIDDQTEDQPTATIWVGTEGAPMVSPLLCCEARTGMRFACALERARIADQVALLPCCHNGDDIACIRDTFDDPDDPDDRARVDAIYRHAAARAGIEWPNDIARSETDTTPPHGIPRP